MDAAVELTARQLSRMRGMTALYHRRFFFDANLTTVLVIGLFVVGWAGVEEAFLLIPVVALVGAVQTAFDSSYLTFARWYAAFLERRLNEMVGERIHVGAELEATYLYELGTPKIVTIPTSGGWTWFSFVTFFYTAVGASAYVFGIIAGWGALMDAPTGVIVAYLVILLGVTIAALGFGIWWFASGESERRLQQVLEDRFGERLDASGF